MPDVNDELTDAAAGGGQPEEIPSIGVVSSVISEPAVETKMDFPHTIIVERLSEQGRANLASNPRLAAQVANMATGGEVHKDGKTWVQNPGGEWPIEKLSTGRYKVTHNYGYYNLSLSVQLGMSRGIAKIIENAPTYFIVETYIDGVLTDAPFVFTLTKVISPPQ